MKRLSWCVDLWFLVIVALVCLASVPVLAPAAVTRGVPMDQPAMESGGPVGQKAPDFVLKNLENQDVRFSEVNKNGPVLLVFW